jgi:nitroimidazol reductase NimA-like FMN-containing flavoprotein (pyridoxamine 5'-phosphate oxidase superfamily)
VPDVSALPPASTGPEHDSAPELIRVLDQAECFALLATDCVGRVVYTRNALPAITPVNYTLDRHRILIRTSSGSAVAHTAMNEDVVAFEVDDIDRRTEEGWSVVVVGVVHVVVDAGELVRAAQHPVRTFAGGTRDTLVALTPGSVTGRWVGGTAPKD